MTTKISLKYIAGSYRLFNKYNKPLVRANKFLDAIESRGLSQQTIRSYGYDLVFLLRWLRAGKKSWRSFNQKDLMSFIAYQRLQKAQPKSINRRLTTCELFYKFCFNHGPRSATGVNRAAPFYRGKGRDRNLGLFHICKPKQVKIRVREPRILMEPLLPNEIGNFLNNVNRYRDLAMIYLMLLCGLRFSEVLLLKSQDLNVSELLIKIHGKGGKERLMPIPPNLLEILRKYISLEKPEDKQVDALFVVLQGRRRGKAMTKAGLRSLFRYRRKVSGVNRANPHRFRHTFGSRMAAENVSLPVLQRMMGHADITTTLQYIHLSTTDIRNEFMRAMNEIQNEYANKIKPTNLT